MKKCFSILFTGRKVGAIGIFQEIESQVFATDEKAALLALYERFEHISKPQVKEWKSPFDSDCLFDYANNTEQLSNHVRHHVESLRRLMDGAARDMNKVHREWHDDQDAADHPLYHAGEFDQYPRELRDAAVLDLVKRHLDTINENERSRAEAGKEQNAKS